MKPLFTVFVVLLMLQTLSAQPWEQDISVFNPSGIPSLSFSQPRFTDLDGDGDMDFWLGNTVRSPLFFRNNGNASVPSFAQGEDYTAEISFLAAEVAVNADMNNDGLLDLITGGYTGLHLYKNIGTNASPVYLEQTGYFANLTTLGNYPVPDLADIDLDGDYDLVVGLSENGAVRVYRNYGTPTNGQFNNTQVINIGDVGLYAYPIFCDYDGDGDMDILCGRDTQGFVYYQNTGNTLYPAWSQNTTIFTNLGMGTYWNSPDLVDLNFDGIYELVYGTASGPLQYYVNTGAPTSPIWQQNTSLFGGVIDVGGASNPVFYDFEGDGDYDMISGSQLGDIKYYRNIGTPYLPSWQADHAYFSSIDHSIYSSVAIGDVNGDGMPDAIIGDVSGQIYYHRNTGIGFVQETGVLPPVSLSGWTVPRLLDWDGDGDLDLVVACEAGNMFYYRNQGTVTNPSWTIVTGFFGTIDVGSNCVPSFGDYDNSGLPDFFVAGNLSGNLLCYTNSGFSWTQNSTYFSGIETDQNAAPALVDLDHDGDLDLVLGDYDGTFKFFRNLRYSAAVLNPPLNPTAVPAEAVTVFWSAPEDGSTSPFVHYNLYLDGFFVASTNETVWVFENLQMGQTYTVWIKAQYIAGESVAASLEIQPTGIEENLQIPISLQNCPNPFNPSTTISFSVPVGQQASVEIINLKGQTVKRWAGLSAGDHSLVWDGKNAQDQQVASGVYLYRLHTSRQTQVRKMMLMK